MRRKASPCAALALFAGLLGSTGCADAGSDGETAPSTSSSDDGSESTSGSATDSAASSEASSGDAGTSEGGSDTGGVECGEPALTDCAQDGGFVSAEAVAGWLDGSTLQLVDARGQADFDVGHLPGAVRIDPAAVRATVDGVSGQVADAATLDGVFAAAGLDPDTPVVFYGPGIETGSARLVWTLAYAGHTAPVYLLDGGYAAWASEGRPTETSGGAAPQPSYPVTLDAGLRVDGTWVFEHLDDTSVTLVDARGAGEYAGGHIPGAIHVDWNTNVGPMGLFLSLSELLELYQSPTDGQTLVTYCATGSRAAVAWVVLRALGFNDVRLYDGSWAEWSNNPAWPVETN